MFTTAQTWILIGEILAIGFTIGLLMVEDKVIRLEHRIFRKIKKSIRKAVLKIESV